MLERGFVARRKDHVALAGEKFGGHLATCAFCRYGQRCDEGWELFIAWGKEIDLAIELEGQIYDDDEIEGGLPCRLKRASA